MKKKIHQIDYLGVAVALNIEVAVIKAVCEVEAPMGGFHADGQPIILFERHKFHQFTGGIYSKKYPAISNPRPGGYKGGKEEHLRLQQAVKLSRTAALKSASWGKFQIMGFNYKLCGFKTVQSFVNAMYKDEIAQLKAFSKFIQVVGLVDELQRKDWKGFAKGYNGRFYYKNSYDVKMRKAYLKHKNV